MASNKSSDLIQSLKLVYSGIHDGFNVISNVRLIRRSSRIKNAIMEILPLYGVYAVVNFWIFLIQYTSFYTNKTWTYRLGWSLFTWFGWLIPMWCVCTVVTYKWYSKLWQQVYSKKQDLSISMNNIQQSNITGINSISNVIHGVLLSSIFIVQISVFDWVLSRLFSSFVGTYYTITNMSWLISWSAFEFRMIHEGMDIFQRVYYFERRWMYFLGYGLPLSIIYNTIFSNVWKLGVCAWYFGMLFMSIRAIRSTPVKWEISEEEKRQEAELRKILPKNPNARSRDPPFQIRLKIFWIAKYCTNWILHKFMTWTNFKPLRIVQ